MQEAAANPMVGSLIFALGGLAGAVDAGKVNPRILAVQFFLADLQFRQFVFHKLAHIIVQGLGKHGLGLVNALDYLFVFPELFHNGCQTGMFLAVFLPAVHIGNYIGVTNQRLQFQKFILNCLEFFQHLFHLKHHSVITAAA